MNTIVVFSFVLALFFLFINGSFVREEKYFGYYILVGASFEAVARISAEFLPGKNNLPGLHLYTLFGFIALCLFFGMLFQSRGVKFQYRPVILIGALLIILNSVFIESIYIYNSNSITGTNVLYLNFCFYFYYLSIKSSEDGSGSPVSFFVASILIKTSVSMLFDLFSNYIMTLDREVSVSLAYLKIFGNLLALFLVLIGFVKIMKRGATR